MKALCAAGFWLLAALAHAQTYKCVDARGVTHYADQPTAGCASAALDIRPSPPISGALTPPSESGAQQEVDFRRRQLEREDASSAQRASGASRQRRRF